MSAALHRVLQPEGWTRPRGYANGVAARGVTIFVGGQIGWNARQEFETDDFVGQVEMALRSIVEVLACAGARPLRGLCRVSSAVSRW